MIRESVQLLEEMNTRLGAISGLSEDDLQSIQEAIVIASEAIVQIRKMITDTDFTSAADEIKFFKRIKPQFDGTLIFYLLLLRLHACQLSDNAVDRHKAYAKELERLQPFYHNYYSFWQYYQMDDTSLDEYYFLRRSQKSFPLLEEDHIHYDWKANALMSIPAARIHAYDLLRKHIAAIVPIHPDKNIIEKEVSLRWSASKAMLIELIYALHEYGVFNNSQLEVKKIADYFSLVFQVKFSNIYKTYEDIRLRKKSPTPFLDALKSALERRIDRDNENAM